MKKSFLAAATIVVLIFICQCKKSPNQVNNINTCQLSEAIDTSGDVSIFGYDNQGRIIVDSTVGTYRFTLYYSYVQSTVGLTFNGQGGTVNLNSSGWPISAAYPDGTNYQAIYNSDGTFSSLSDGTGNVLFNNIVYSGGNIISASVSSNYFSPGGLVTYSYSSNLYKPFDPGYKISALSGEIFNDGGGFATNGFSPQPFSKNLLKRAIYPDGEIFTYSYQTDSKGNIIYVSAVDSVAGLVVSDGSSHYSYNCQ